MHRVDRADACKLSYGLYTNTMAHACTQKCMCMYTRKICNVKKRKMFLHVQNRCNFFYSVQDLIKKMM